MRRFRVPSHPEIKRPRRLILKLLLPGVSLVRMDLVALRNVRDRRLLPQCLQRDLRLQSGVNPPPRLLRHRSLRLSNGAAVLQLNPRSQNQGPLQPSPIEASRTICARENPPSLMSLQAALSLSWVVMFSLNFE